MAHGGNQNQSNQHAHNPQNPNQNNPLQPLNSPSSSSISDHNLSYTSSTTILSAIFHLPPQEAPSMAIPKVSQYQEDLLLHSSSIDSQTIANANSQGMSIENKIKFLESLMERSVIEGLTD